MLRAAVTLTLIWSRVALSTPTAAPTVAPTSAPSFAPTALPPGNTYTPTAAPTAPTPAPTPTPTTDAPTAFPPGAVASTVIREYTFNVSYFQVNPDKSATSWVQGINGQLPGPTIRVRQGERLRVIVNNQLQTETVSIHWHGFEMRAAQEYDGSVGVTQCGIPPHYTFVYDFVVDEHPGSYQYYGQAAHLEHVAPRGVFGPLIVDPRQGEQEPWNYAGDAMILLNDWWPVSPHEIAMRKEAGLTRPTTVTKAFNNVGGNFYNLLINGKGAYSVFHKYDGLDMGMVTKKTHVSDLWTLTPRFGETWRLRVGNGGAHFAMRFRIDKHRLLVVQTDAADVEPYWCDVLSMAAGERFDVLVTFDQTPGSYWIRVETLEEHYGFHHGQLAVLRYHGAMEDVLPSFGYEQRHYLFDNPELVMLNCIDEGPLSPTCRPITDLRRKDRGNQHTNMGTAADEMHDFEVNSRIYHKPDDSHFTRVIDLRATPNTYENQHDGEYVQFRPPALPFTHTSGTDQALHPNSLAMRVTIGETIRVIIQHQDREAHSWHLHGHKFAVLGVGFPDYVTDCDVVFCRNKKNEGWWGRDGMPPGILDPEKAPLKDTVHVPPGGWVVIQFKADNPGWWFLHCQRLLHFHDGMGLLLIEGDSTDFPRRLTDVDYLTQKGFPTCEKEKKKLKKLGHYGVSCPCWENIEIFLDNNLRPTYKCARSSLCGHLILGSSSKLEPQMDERSGKRNRAAGRWWRITLFSVEISLVIALFFVANAVRKRNAAIAFDIQEHVVRSLSSKEKKKEKKQSITERTEEEQTRRSSRKSTVTIYSRPPGMELTWVVRQVSPSGFTSHTSDWVSGSLPRSSVMAIIGKPDMTDPWLRFFAGCRPDPHLQVSGQLNLAGKPDYTWKRSALHSVRSYVHDVKPIRPSCTVVSQLDLVLKLMDAPTLFCDAEERQAHLARYMKLFGLVSYAGTPIADLPKDILMRVALCQEVLLPRPLLIIKDPFGSLDAKGAINVSQLFKTISTTIGVTIIFSTPGITGQAADSVSHSLLVGAKCKPYFDDIDGMYDRFEELGQAVPNGVHPVEHASQLQFEGKLKLDHEGVSSSEDIPENMKVEMIPYDDISNAVGFGSESCGMTNVGALSTALRNVGGASPGDESKFLNHKPRQVLEQLWILLKYQLSADLQEQMTVYKLAETIGIGLAAGVVWLGKGSGETQTELGETVGVLFFTTALWTVPPVFQALAMSTPLFNRFVVECLNGMYPLWTGVLCFALSTIAFSTIWCCVWQSLAYAMADVGPDIGSMMMMHLTLGMNVFTMRTIGLVLGLVISNSMLNVVIANLVAQLFMLTNGFYTQLPAWFNFVTYFSIPRYTFRALLKLEYSWEDTWLVHPFFGASRVGSGTYIPSEFTGFFQLMRLREMDVMASPFDSNVWPEIGVLMFIACLLLSFYLSALNYRVRQLELVTQKPGEKERRRCCCFRW